jgi:hypothetical protein
MIFRGAGWMTLLTPLAMALLLTWLLMEPSAKSSDLSLIQFLLAVGIGSAINVVLGFVLNRELHPDGVRHHFFFVPMQWPALAIMLACAVVALLK